MAKEQSAEPVVPENDVDTSLLEAVERLKKAYITHVQIVTGDTPSFAEDVTMVDVINSVANYLETV